MSQERHLRVGLISDTHGLLRPEARTFLAGCDYIIHGGDVGCADILEELAAMAPLIAVRGNNDKEPWAERLPDDRDDQGGRRIRLRHPQSRGTRHRPASPREWPSSSPVIRTNRHRGARRHFVRQPGKLRTEALQAADFRRRNHRLRQRTVQGADHRICATADRPRAR